ncbi:MAG: hypothetical protein HY547_06420 [Elusimicrobia bacterium]|nr:hypothetical protein [Elusimicrobiota bacterium]
MRLLISVIVAIVATNYLVALYFPERYPEKLPQAFATSRGSAGGTRDLILVGLGLRRLASDIAMIDLLVYYGTHEHAGHETGGRFAGDPSLTGRAPPGVLRRRAAGSEILGSYIDLLPLARRILGLDPYFRYATLYAAGALAFNEDRTRQAVDLLNEARLRDQKYWPYTLTLSSIAYKKINDFPELVRSLEPLIELPECPSMLKNISANIYWKIGRREDALRIYRGLRDFAPEDDYRSNARYKLELLGEK